jgi:hypothetical protein
MAALAGLEGLDLSGVDLTRLAPDKAARVRQLLDQGDLEAFIRRVTPHHPPAPHMRPIIERIAQARRRPIRTCISMPPRHGKSETVFNGLAWWMQAVPADTHAYLSYNDNQATSQSRKIRQRAQEGGVALSAEMANLGEWRTTSGGGLFASGVGGALTGKGITGLAVVDDPFKGREDADSSRMRDNVWDWFTSVFTRAQPAASAWNGVVDPLDPSKNRPVRLEVPLRAPWLKEFLHEVGLFTGVNDKADDQVDCLSGAWNEADKSVPFQPPPGPLIKLRP